ncbi:MAG: hypothetical protein F4X65_01435 [Chloroflexi bacterium]|nr:hypothetical protein [Chloroflexota bacterium]
MKTISVSVEDDTHRLARIRAAETGTTVSAMMRDLLLELLRQPAEVGQAETESLRRGRLMDEVLNKFKEEGIGVDTSLVLTREELYNSDASH